MKTILKLVCILLITLMFNCKSDEELMVEPNFAFSIREPADKILHDQKNKKYYMLQGDVNGRIICFDYVNKVECGNNVTKIPSAFKDHGFCLGHYDGSSEVYLGNDNVVYIFDGNDLTLKDSITNVGISITGISFVEPNLVFIKSFDREIYVYDRSSKQIISNSTFGGYLTSILTYEKGDTIAVREFYDASTDYIFVHFFDTNGNFIGHKYVENYLDRKEVAEYNANKNIIILTTKGVVISERDEEVLINIESSFDEQYDDFIIEESGNFIYAAKHRGGIQKISYPDFQLVNEIETVSRSLNRRQLLISDDKLIEIVLEGSGGSDYREVYNYHYDLF
jgi:hypothetical protein